MACGEQGGHIRGAGGASLRTPSAARAAESLLHASAEEIVRGVPAELGGLCCNRTERMPLVWNTSRPQP